MPSVVVHYPADAPLHLRVSTDWSRALSPDAVSTDGTARTFTVPDGPGVYFKAVRTDPEGLRWSQGSNYLLLAEGNEVYPHFDGGPDGRITDRMTIAGRTIRVFLPSGYDENVLKRYPVLLVLDGANVFFPEEAFSGHEWEVDETLTALNAINLVDKVIVVAVWSVPEDRQGEYTAPGYHAFGEHLVDELLPELGRRFRTLECSSSTAIMGASLGGVAALHTALAHPDVFGMAACLSSTFGFQDDLMERVRNGNLPSVRLYLDSGLPGDNWQVTLEMYEALVSAGHRPGQDVLLFGFPGALHHERAWAQRVHLPLQFFFGRAFRACSVSRSEAASHRPPTG